MANTKYQVNLAIDGKHTVTVQSDDPAAATEALVWAKKTYDQLGRLAAKPCQTLSKEQWEGPDRVARAEAHALQEEATQEEPPICAVHHLAMAKVQGKRGAFWSCHAKMPDGTWCSFKPR